MNAHPLYGPTNPVVYISEDTDFGLVPSPCVPSLRNAIHHKHAKSLFKHPGFLFECLCDQQDSYKWPNATWKTAKRKSVRQQKCHFSSSLFLSCYDFCSNNDNSKTVQALTLILARNRCPSQCAVSQPLSVFIASNSPWSIKAIHNTLWLLSVAKDAIF